MTTQTVIVPRVRPRVAVASNVFIGNASYSGDENTILAFEIQRDLGWSQVVSVDWVITNAGGTPTHSGTATFQSGESLKTITVLLPAVAIDDIGSLTLSNAQNLSGGVSPVLASPSQVAVTVVDTDAPVSIAINLSAASYSGDENTNISFTVLRAGAEATDIATVDWTIAGATTVPLSGTAQFNVGETSQLVTVAAGIVITDEVGTLTLSNQWRRSTRLGRSVHCSLLST